MFMQCVVKEKREYFFCYIIIASHLAPEKFPLVTQGNNYQKRFFSFSLCSNIRLPNRITLSKITDLPERYFGSQYEDFI